MEDLRPSLRAIPFLFALSYFSMAMGESMAADIATLTDTRWTLVRVGDEEVTSTHPPYFEISNGIISGYDGCNNFGGPLHHPREIRVGQRACASREVVFSLNLADPLGQIKMATLVDEMLILPANGKRPEAVFSGKTADAK